MFTYITLNRDVYMDDYGDDKISLPYVSNDVLRLFNTKEEAFVSAETEAKDELEGLVDDDDDNSFNIVEDDDYQKGNSVKILCYTYENETYTVTERIIKEIK